MAEPYVAIQVIMMPADVNPQGTIFGGVILSYIDQAGAIGARREVIRAGGKPPMGLAVGVVDVKNTWIEPPELVADRLRQVLRYIDAERVHVTPDCGFSQTARYIATKKLASMVQGVCIVRRELFASSSASSRGTGVQQ